MKKIGIVILFLVHTHVFAQNETKTNVLLYKSSTDILPIVYTGSKLPKGTYYVKIIRKSEIITQRFVIN